MESFVAPLQITDFPEAVREGIKTFRTQEGQEAILQNLDILNNFVLGTREFSETEQAYYRKPFLVPGEDRRPMLFDFSIDGIPEYTHKIVDDYSRWLTQSDLPKLMIRADPSYLLKGRLYDFAHKWPNQTEVVVKGTHFIQETTPHEIGEAISAFVRGLRGGAA
jgi:haloalkane dehalogenase